MSRIDFAFGASDRLRMACEVVRKHYLAGRKIVVYSSDVQRLTRFDRLLWGFDATAFIPHVMANDPLAAQTPVLLCSSAPQPADPDADQSADSPALACWLLNLDLQCPPQAEQFERILEIVSADEQDKLAARDRWKRYQAAGHALHAHDVSKR